MMTFGFRITYSQLASWGNIRNKNRPKLKKVGPEVHPDQDTLREEVDANEEDTWV